MRKSDLSYRLAIVGFGCGILSLFVFAFSHYVLGVHPDAAQKLMIITGPLWVFLTARELKKGR